MLLLCYRSRVDGWLEQLHADISRERGERAPWRRRVWYCRGTASAAACTAHPAAPASLYPVQAALTFSVVQARSISHEVDACMCHKGSADYEVKSCKVCQEMRHEPPNRQCGRSLSHLVKQLLHQLDLCSACGRFSILRHVFLDARKHLHSPRAVVRAQLQQRRGDAVLQVSRPSQNLRLTVCTDMLLLVCCPCSGAAGSIWYGSDSR